MIKLSLSLIVVMVMPLSFLKASEAMKINTVDFPYLFNNYWKVQNSEKKFQSTIKDVQNMLKSVVEKGQKKEQELKALQVKSKNPVLTDEARKNAEDQLKAGIPEFRKIEVDLAKQRQLAEQNLAQERNKISAILRNEIKKVIQQVAQEKGADLVLDKSNSQNILLFANESYEITTDVLDILNADKPEGFQPLKKNK